jgi:hypothetical protein
MSMALRITKRDGAVLWVSSWAAWRLFAHLHMRRSCPACSGEAAEALGVSRKWFDINVAPEVPHVRRNHHRLFTVKALEKWAEANMERA